MRMDYVGWVSLLSHLGRVSREKVLEVYKITVDKIRLILPSALLPSPIQGCTKKGEHNTIWIGRLRAGLMGP